MQFVPKHCQMYAPFHGFSIPPAVYHHIVLRWSWVVELGSSKERMLLLSQSLSVRPSAQAVAMPLRAKLSGSSAGTKERRYGRQDGRGSVLLEYRHALECEHIRLLDESCPKQLELAKQNVLLLFQLPV
jgi:hypothetical protein